MAKRAPLPTDLDSLRQQRGDAYAVAVLMGFDIGDAESLIAHFHTLEERAQQGDATVAMELQRLHASCHILLSDGEALADPAHWAHEQAQVCEGLPQRDADFAARVVAWGAALGNREAILAELDHPPAPVRHAPDSPQAADWAAGALTRLESLIATGDRPAMLRLGLSLAADAWGHRDLPRAADLLHQYVNGAPPNDHQITVAMSALDLRCGSVSPSGWGPQCRN